MALDILGNSLTAADKAEVQAVDAFVADFLAYEARASDVFCADEIEALHLRVKKCMPRAIQPPTLRETVRMLGRLGGHLGRKSDGEPGLTVLWRGWQRLYEDVEMLRAYKQTLGRMNSS